MKCPNCYEEIEYEEQIDSEFFGDTFYNVWTGTCKKCGRRYKWEEKYIFDNIQFIEDITNES